MSTDRAHREAVERAVQLIRSQFAEPDTLRRLSDAAWLSRFHLHRIFSEVTGVSPGRFLAAVRLDAAKRMLLDPRLRVVDICYEVGYVSVGTFTSQFTALVGTQPGRFRQLVEQYRDARVQVPPMSQPDGSTRVRMHGTIGCEDGFSGWACLGLFSSRVPQGVPAGCALAAVPGPFAIDAQAPVESPYLLAVAMPPTDRMIEVLVPEQSRIRVGCTVLTSTEPPDCHVELRMQHPIDPPVVLAYPLLLASRSPNAMASIR